MTVDDMPKWPALRRVLFGSTVPVATGSVIVLQGADLTSQDLKAVGSDIDPAGVNSTLSYSKVSGPSWVSVDSNTGVIRSEERRVGKERRAGRVRAQVEKQCR